MDPSPDPGEGSDDGRIGVGDKLARMDWYGWVTWGGTFLIAASGLVLGIRAELRAIKYETLWVAAGGRPIYVFNRTGEDATNVELEIVGGKPIGRTVRDLIQPDTAFEIDVVPLTPQMESFSITVVISWTRPKTGKRYRRTV